MNSVFVNVLTLTALVAVCGAVMGFPASVMAADGFAFDEDVYFDEDEFLDHEMLDLYDVFLPTVGWFRLTTDSGHTMTFDDTTGIFQVIDQSKMLSAYMSEMPAEALDYASTLSSMPKQVFFSLFTEPDDDVADVGIYWDDPSQTTVSLFRPGFNAAHTGDQASIGHYGFSFDGGEMTVHRPYEDGFHASFAGRLWVSSGGGDDHQPLVTRAYIVGEVCAPHPADHPRSFALYPPNIEDTPCEVQEEKFQVVDVQPENRRENVDYNDPAIVVTMSKAINPRTLDGNVTLLTMSASGDEMVVSGEARLVEHNAFQFYPDNPLLDMVIYEVRMKGGDNGVKSVDEDFLEGDYSWRFSTLLDLNWLHEFSGDGEDDGPVKIRVYQTVEDAPLLAGKPTLTRVWIDWAPHDHISDDWQPKSFRAHISAEDSHDGMVYTDYKEPFIIRRPDQFTATHKRHALDSTNLFNWRPQQVTQSTELIIEIEPYDVYPMLRDEHIFEQQKSVDRWPHDPKNLTFDYLFIRVGPWKDDVSADDRSLVRATVRSSERYITQLFPVLSTSGRFAGDLSVGFVDRIPDSAVYFDFIDAGAELLTDAIGTGRAKRYFTRVMQRLHNRYASETNADVIVGITPLDVVGFGESYTPIDPGDWTHATFMTRTVMVPVWEEGIQSNIIAHEIGHAYHLHHLPQADTKEDVERVNREWQTGIFPGVEGFRMASGGTHGSNKSSTDGNAEDSDRLLSFMFPVVRKQPVTFIANSQYDSLLQTMRVEALVHEAVQSGNSGVQPLQVASTNPQAMLWAMNPSAGLAESMHAQHGSASKMLVAGYIRKEDNTVFFSSVRRRLQSVREGPDGSFSAVTFDDRGYPLAEKTFGEYVIPYLDDDDDEWMYFQVALPEDPDVASIEIRKDHSVLGKLVRPEQQPAVSFVPSLFSSDSDDGWMTVAWDGQGEDLVYALLYSPDGNSRWQLLALDTKDTTMAIDTQLLEPGENPTLRVVADNLFDEVEDRISITFESRMQPIWLNGGATETVGTLFDAEVTFDRDLDFDSLAGRFTLVDANGEIIPSTYQYDAHARVAILTPTAPLLPGTYTARLSPGIADQYGGVLEEEATRVFYVEAGEHDHLVGATPHFFDDLPLTAADRGGDVSPITTRDPRIDEWLFPSAGTTFADSTEQPMDVDEYLGLWQDVATGFGIGDEMAEFLDFMGDSFGADDSLWDVMFQEIEDEDIEGALDDWLGGWDTGSTDDWFSGYADWDAMQAELDEAEAMLQALSDLGVARPVEADVEAVTAPNTGVLYMDGHRWAFDIETCVLPSPSAYEITVTGSGVVEGTGRAFEISLNEIDGGFGEEYFMTSIAVEAENDILMASAYGTGESDITLALTEDGVLNGEGAITSFTTFQKYDFVLTAHCQ